MLTDKGPIMAEFDGAYQYERFTRYNTQKPYDHLVVSIGNIEGTEGIVCSCALVRECFPIDIDYLREYDHRVVSAAMFGLE